MCGFPIYRVHCVLSLGFTACLFALVAVPTTWATHTISECPIQRVLLPYSDNASLPFAQVQDEVFRDRFRKVPQGVQISGENLDGSLFAGNSPDGLFADFYPQGENILSGGKPEPMTPLVEPHRYAFVQRALKRFQIPESRLPA